MVERRYAQIVGWGYHVPEKVITNKDLEKIVDTNDQWIVERTEIDRAIGILDQVLGSQKV